MTDLADIDKTTANRPYHLAVVLPVDVGEDSDKGERLGFIYVIVPSDVVGNLRHQLRAVVRVKVKGTVEDVQGAVVHLASSLEMAVAPTRH